MSNPRAQREGQERIPILEEQVSFNPSDVANLQGTMERGMQVIEQSVAKNQAEVLTMKLKNDYLNFKQLGYENIDQVFNRNQSDPDKLQKELGDVKKALMKAVPFQLRQDAEEWWTATTQGPISKSKDNQRTLLNDQIKAESIKSLDLASKQINLSGEELFSANEEILARATASIVSGTADYIEALNVTDINGQPVYSEVEKANALEKLKLKTLSTGVKRFFDKIPTIEEKAQFMESFAKNELMMNWVDDNLNPTQIPVAQELGFEEYDNVLNHFVRGIRSTQKQDKLTTSLGVVQPVLSKESKPTPGLKSYDEAVNLVYDEIIAPEVEAIEGPAASLQKSARMLSYVRDTEVLPKTVLNQVKSWVSVGDDEQIIAAADFYNGLAETYPGLKMKFDTKDFGILSLVASAVRNDSSRSNALELAKKMRDPVLGEIYQQRLKEFDQGAKDIDFAEFARDTIEGSLPKFFKSKLTAPLRYSPAGKLAKLILKDAAEPKEFPEGINMPENVGIRTREMVRNYTILSGDLEIGKKIAQDMIPAIWQPSRANGGKITGYSVEQFYDIVGVDRQSGSAEIAYDPNWIRKDLETTVLSNNKSLVDAGVLKEKGFQFEPSRAIYVADLQTEREARLDGAPTYLIYVPDAEGKMVLLEDEKGEIVRWAPSTEQERVRYDKRVEGMLRKSELKFNFISNMGSPAQK